MREAQRSRLSGLLYSVLGYAFGPLAGFLTAPILAHGLGVTGRGEATAATAPLVLGMAVFTMGLPEATTYYVARNPGRLRSILLKSTLLLLAPALAGTLFFIGTGPYFSDHKDDLIEIMFYCTLMLFPALWVGVVRGCMVGIEKFPLVAAERMGSSLTKLLAVAALAASGQLTVLTASLTIGITTFVGGLVYVPSLMNLRNSKSSDPGAQIVEVGTTEILTYGLRQWFGSLAGVLLARLDQLLMTPLSSSYELGLYVVAVALADLVLVVNNALREVVFSMESKGAQGARIAQAARISNLAAFLTGLSVVVGGIWVIPWLFGKDFSDAWIVTAVLIVGAILGNPGSLAGTGLAAIGRPELRSWSLVAGCIVNFALMLWLVPAHGALGAAFATMGGSVTAASGNLLFTRKLLGTKVSDYIIFKKEDLELAGKAIAKVTGKLGK